MKQISLLDCTLRDGGFVNDWDFGFGTAKSIISRLASSGIEIVEIGLLDDRREYDINRTILPGTNFYSSLLKNICIRDTLIAAMIDYGTCSIDKIEPSSQTNIDIIRVIFKKHLKKDALEFCNELQEKGYKVSVQPVSITSYEDNELVELLEFINEIKPFAVSIVDTYGLMHHDQLINYFRIFDKTLLPEIIIGYHSHNNFQVAYTNSIELMKLDSNRHLVLDGTLYGMGKGAGNANTELLANYLNKNFDKNYSLDQLLEAIDVDILKEYDKNKWGYSLCFFISASNDCHPNYVKFLMDTKTLAIKSINEILKNIPDEEKLNYNESLIENLYKQYQENEIDDSNDYIELNKIINGRKVLILAPGKTLETNKSNIIDYIKQNNPVVFSINFLNDDYSVDFVFLGNPKRYSQFYHKIYGDDSAVKVICTSNVVESNNKIDYKFNFNSLKLDNDLIRDNPLLLLIKIISKLSANEVALAGADGYLPDDQSNYYANYLSFLFCDDEVLLRNELIKKELEGLGQKINIFYLTPSMYEISK